MPSVRRLVVVSSSPMMRRCIDCCEKARFPGLPFVVLFLQHCGGESQQRGSVGENAHDFGAPIDLGVDPLDGVGGADCAPMLTGEREVGQHIRLGVAQQQRNPCSDSYSSAFGAHEFTIEEAASYTLLETLFLPESHLKTLTLRPAEERGELDVARLNNARAGRFTPGTRMKFR